MKNISLKTLSMLAGLACLNVYPVAQAQFNDLNYPPEAKFQSTLSRDDVRAEYIKAAQEGTLPKYGEVEYPQAIVSFQSSSTRGEVNAEYLQALKDGSLPQTGEISPAITATNFTSTLTREAVVAETLDWIRAQNSDVMMGGK